MLEPRNTYTIKILFLLHLSHNVIALHVSDQSYEQNVGDIIPNQNNNEDFSSIFSPSQEWKEQHINVAGSDYKLYNIIKELSQHRCVHEIIVHFYFLRHEKLNHIRSIHSSLRVLRSVLSKYPHYFYSYKKQETESNEDYLNSLILIPEGVATTDGNKISDASLCDDQNQQATSVIGPNGPGAKGFYEFDLSNRNHYKGQDLNVYIDNNINSSDFNVSSAYYKPTEIKNYHNEFGELGGNYFKGQDNNVQVFQPYGVYSNNILNERSDNVDNSIDNLKNYSGRSVNFFESGNADQISREGLPTNALNHEKQRVYEFNYPRDHYKSKDIWVDLKAVDYKNDKSVSSSQAIPNVSFQTGFAKKFLEEDKDVSSFKKDFKSGALNWADTDYQSAEVISLNNNYNNIPQYNKESINYPENLEDKYDNSGKDIRESSNLQYGSFKGEERAYIGDSLKFQEQLEEYPSANVVFKNNIIVGSDDKQLFSPGQKMGSYIQYGQQEETSQADNYKIDRNDINLSADRVTEPLTKAYSKSIEDTIPCFTASEVLDLGTQDLKKNNIVPCSRKFSSLPHRHSLRLSSQLNLNTPQEINKSPHNTYKHSWSSLNKHPSHIHFHNNSPSFGKPIGIPLLPNLHRINSDNFIRKQESNDLSKRYSLEIKGIKTPIMLSYKHPMTTISEKNTINTNLFPSQNRYNTQNFQNLLSFNDVTKHKYYSLPSVFYPREFQTAQPYFSISEQINKNIYNEQDPFISLQSPSMSDVRTPGSVGRIGYWNGKCTPTVDVPCIYHPFRNSNPYGRFATEINQPYVNRKGMVSPTSFNTCMHENMEKGDHLHDLSYTELPDDIQNSQPSNVSIYPQKISQSFNNSQFTPFSPRIVNLRREEVVPSVASLNTPSIPKNMPQIEHGLHTKLSYGVPNTQSSSSSTNKVIIYPQEISQRVNNGEYTPFLQQVLNPNMKEMILPASTLNTPCKYKNMRQIKHGLHTELRYDVPYTQSSTNNLIINPQEISQSVNNGHYTPILQQVVNSKRKETILPTFSFNTPCRHKSMAQLEHGIDTNLPCNVYKTQTSNDILYPQKISQSINNKQYKPFSAQIDFEADTSQNLDKIYLNRNPYPKLHQHIGHIRSSHNMSLKPQSISYTNPRFRYETPRIYHMIPRLGYARNNIYENAIDWYQTKPGQNQMPNKVTYQHNFHKLCKYNTFPNYVQTHFNHPWFQNQPLSIRTPETSISRTPGYKYIRQPPLYENKAIYTVTNYEPFEKIQNILKQTQHRKHSNSLNPSSVPLFHNQNNNNKPNFEPISNPTPRNSNIKIQYNNNNNDVIPCIFSQKDTSSKMQSILLPASSTLSTNVNPILWYGRDHPIHNKQFLSNTEYLNNIAFTPRLYREGNPLLHPRTKSTKISQLLRDTEYFTKKESVPHQFSTQVRPTLPFNINQAANERSVPMEKNILNFYVDKPCQHTSPTFTSFKPKYYTPTFNYEHPRPNSYEYITNREPATHHFSTQVRPRLSFDINQAAYDQSVNIPKKDPSPIILNLDKPCQNTSPTFTSFKPKYYKPTIKYEGSSPHNYEYNTKREPATHHFSTQVRPRLSFDINQAAYDQSVNIPKKDPSSFILNLDKPCQNTSPTFTSFKPKYNKPTINYESSSPNNYEYITNRESVPHHYSTQVRPTLSFDTNQVAYDQSDTIPKKNPFNYNLNIDKPCQNTSPTFSTFTPKYSTPTNNYEHPRPNNYEYNTNSEPATHHYSTQIRPTLSLDTNQVAYDQSVTIPKQNPFNYNLNIDKPCQNTSPTFTSFKPKYNKPTINYESSSPNNYEYITNRESVPHHYSTQVRPTLSFDTNQVAYDQSVTIPKKNPFNYNLNIDKPCQNTSPTFSTFTPKYSTPTNNYEHPRPNNYEYNTNSEPATHHYSTQIRPTLSLDTNQVAYDQSVTIPKQNPFNYKLNVDKPSQNTSPTFTSFEPKYYTPTINYEGSRPIYLNVPCTNYISKLPLNGSGKDQYTPFETPQYPPKTTKSPTIIYPQRLRNVYMPNTFVTYNQKNPIPIKVNTNKLERVDNLQSIASPSEYFKQYINRAKNSNPKHIISEVLPQCSATQKKYKEQNKNFMTDLPSIEPHGFQFGVSTYKTPTQHENFVHNSLPEIQNHRSFNSYYYNNNVDNPNNYDHYTGNVKDKTVIDIFNRPSITTSKPLRHNILKNNLPNKYTSIRSQFRGDNNPQYVAFSKYYKPGFETKNSPTVFSTCKNQRKWESQSKSINTLPFEIMESINSVNSKNDLNEHIKSQNNLVYNQYPCLKKPYSTSHTVYGYKTSPLISQVYPETNSHALIQTYRPSITYQESLNRNIRTGLDKQQLYNNYRHTYYGLDNNINSFMIWPRHIPLKKNIPCFSIDKINDPVTQYTYINQSPQYNQLNIPRTSERAINNIKDIYKNKINEELPKLLPVQYFDDNFNNPNSNFKERLSVDLGRITVAKYDDNNRYIIKTDNPYVNLIVWKSKIKTLTANLVIQVRDSPAMNFLPVINGPVSTDEANRLAKDIIKKIYGDPLVISGKYSVNSPYAVVINENGSKRNVLWPALCSYK